MATSHKNTLQFRIRKIPYKARAIEIFTDREHNNDRPGLLLSTPYEQHQVIAPSRLLKPGDQVMLHTLVNEKWHDVVMEGYVHHTEFVCRLQVSPESRSTGSGL